MQNKRFVIPAITWNLESPCIYNGHGIKIGDRALNLLGVPHFALLKIQKEIVWGKSRIKTCVIY